MKPNNNIAPLTNLPAFAGLGLDTIISYWGHTYLYIMKILRTSNLLYFFERDGEKILFTTEKADAKQLSDIDAKNMMHYLQMDLGIITTIEPA